MSFENDQRISAYLLGELSTEEKERFEKEMNQNPALKKAVDEQKIFFVSLKSELDFKSDVQLDQKHRTAINQKLYEGKIPFWKALMTPKVGLSFASTAIVVLAVTLVVPKMMRENPPPATEAISIPPSDPRSLPPDSHAAPEVMAMQAPPPPADMAPPPADVAADNEVAAENAEIGVNSADVSAAPESAPIEPPVEPMVSALTAPVAKMQAKAEMPIKPQSRSYAIEYGQGIEKNISAPENIDLLLIDCLEKNYKSNFPKRITLKFKFTFDKQGKLLNLKSLNKDMRFKSLAACTVKTVDKKVKATQKKSSTFTYPITFVIR